MADLREKVEAELEPQRLEPLVRDAPVTCASFKQEVKQFVEMREARCPLFNAGA